MDCYNMIYDQQLVSDESFISQSKRFNPILPRTLMNARNLNLASIAQGFMTELHYLSEYLVGGRFLLQIHSMFCFRCWGWPGSFGMARRKRVLVAGPKKVWRVRRPPGFRRGRRKVFEGTRWTRACRLKKTSVRGWIWGNLDSEWRAQR